MIPMQKGYFDSNTYHTPAKRDSFNTGKNSSRQQDIFYIKICFYGSANKKRSYQESI